MLMLDRFFGEFKFKNKKGVGFKLSHMISSGRITQEYLVNAFLTAGYLQGFRK